MASFSVLRQSLHSDLCLSDKKKKKIKQESVSNIKEDTVNNQRPTTKKRVAVIPPQGITLSYLYYSNLLCNISAADLNTML